MRDVRRAGAERARHDGDVHADDALLARRPARHACDALHGAVDRRGARQAELHVARRLADGRRRLRPRVRRLRGARTRRGAVRSAAVRYRGAHASSGEQQQVDVMYDTIQIRSHT